VRRIALVLAAVVVATGLSAASVGGGAARQFESGEALGGSRTLVVLPVRISDFAQDGDELTWMSGRCAEYARPPFDRITIRAVAGGRPQVLSQTVCGIWSEPDLTGVALAGSQTLFWWPVEGGNGTFYQLATEAPGDARAAKLGIFERGPGFGNEITGAGGAGDTLIYAVADWTTGNACISQPVPCVHSVAGGSVWRVADGKAVRVSGVPVPAALGVSADEIAVAPAQRRWSGRDLPIPAAANGSVEIRDARTGGLRARFTPHGRVLELAVAGDSAAVLVSDGSVRQIERYDARSGRLLASAQVASSARDLDVAGGEVIFRVADEIQLFAGGRVTTLGHASGRPVGLSIEGRRIAWAENVDGRGRIESITLR
jgi:hypothetical protein